MNSRPAYAEREVGVCRVDVIARDGHDVLCERAEERGRVSQAAAGQNEEQGSAASTALIHSPQSARHAPLGLRPGAACQRGRTAAPRAAARTATSPGRAAEETCERRTALDEAQLCDSARTTQTLPRQGKMEGCSPTVVRSGIERIGGKRRGARDRGHWEHALAHLCTGQAQTEGQRASKRTKCGVLRAWTTHLSAGERSPTAHQSAAR
jgi:hypothetical protein